MFTGNNYYWENKIVYMLFFKFQKYIGRIKVSVDSNANYTIGYRKILKLS